MKEKLLSTTALAAVLLGVLSLADLAQAADAVTDEPPVPPVEPQMAAPFLWTGPYLGGHIGYSWGRGHNVTDSMSENGPVETGFDSMRFNGLVGGLHAGYNYQFTNPFVLGIEADIDLSSRDGSHHLVLPGYDGDAGFKSKWQGSARLRAGYAVAERTLIYATGGLALAGAELQLAGWSDSNTHIGWTVGGGIEHAFTPNWIGRFEVRYSDFNKKSYATPFGNMKMDFNQTTATVGISYKF